MNFARYHIYCNDNYCHKWRSHTYISIKLVLNESMNKKQHKTPTQYSKHSAQKVHFIGNIQTTQIAMVVRTEIVTNTTLEPESLTLKTVTQFRL